jgi:hypothetical protein
MPDTRGAHRRQTDIQVVLDIQVYFRYFVVEGNEHVGRIEVDKHGAS